MDWKGVLGAIISIAVLLIAGSVEGALVIWLIIALILYLIIRSGENEKKEQEIRVREFREKNNENYKAKIIEKVGNLGTPNESDNRHLDRMFEFEVHNILGTYIIKKFIGFGNVPTITIPKTYKGMQILHIGKDAFRNCHAITTVKIEANILEIGESAFEDCRNLSNVTFPMTVEIINDKSFAFCSKIKKITFPENVQIKGSPFRQTKLEYFQIPKTQKKLETSFLSYTNIKEIHIPSNVEEIGYDAFCGCEHLERIIIEPGTKRIGSYAFFNCPKLKVIVIPETVEEIGDHLFGYFVESRPTTLSGRPDMRYNPTTHIEDIKGLVIYCAPGSVVLDRYRNWYKCKDINTFKG